MGLMARVSTDLLADSKRKLANLRKSATKFCTEDRGSRQVQDWRICYSRPQAKRREIAAPEFAASAPLTTGTMTGRRRIGRHSARRCCDDDGEFLLDWLQSSISSAIHQNSRIDAQTNLR